MLKQSPVATSNDAALLIMRLALVSRHRIARPLV
jgi:hypothetical protein